MSVWIVQGCTGPDGTPKKVNAADTTPPHTHGVNICRDTKSALSLRNSMVTLGRAAAKSASVTRPPWVLSASPSHVPLRSKNSATKTSCWSNAWWTAVRRGFAVSEFKAHLTLTALLYFFFVRSFASLCPAFCELFRLSCPMCVCVRVYVFK